MAPGRPHHLTLCGRARGVAEKTIRPAAAIWPTPLYAHTSEATPPCANLGAGSDRVAMWRGRLDGSNSGKRSGPMATYRMVYGDDERTVQETFTDIDEVEREDGWVVLFRGKEAILRVQEAHVQSLEQLDG